MSVQVPGVPTNRRGTWWQSGVIYQIYPLSFADSNGDGIGDLNGITERLDYVVSLGVDAIWLSPIYTSPMTDNGYDVADHTAVNPLFGTMADFDRLLAETQRRGLRLLLDLVPNHTSDLHQWFVDSRSSRTNPKRDWYIWRDPAPGGGPPNNWLGYHGPSWSLDDITGQYYLHQRRDMPELNYRNPAVLEAMLGVMRFWLDRGVDGFRVDVIGLLIKDDRFLDEPSNPDYQPNQNRYYSLEHIYTLDQDDVHEIIRAFRQTLDAYPGDRVMLGEIDPIPRLMSYYGSGLDECHLPFNLNLQYTPWRAGPLQSVIEAYNAAVPPGAWPNWILGNHDQPRVASRVGRAQVHVAQMLLLTLRGTPICYYGDELGMTNGVIPRHRLRDAMGYDEIAIALSRDPERTPMHWNASANAGFCPDNVEPWLPVNSEHVDLNVEAETSDPRSVLNLFRALVKLRREIPALARGDYRSVDAGDNVLAYERAEPPSRVLVVLNLGDEEISLDASRHGGSPTLLASTGLDRVAGADARQLDVRPNEGVILRLDDLR